MTITYSKNLSTREALCLHANFAKNAGFAHEMVFIRQGESKPIYLGLKIGTMRDFVDALNQRSEGVAQCGMVGFAGPDLLSCHFREGARERFLAALDATTTNNFVVQVSGKCPLWHKFAQRWLEVMATQHWKNLPPVEVRPVPHHVGVVDYIFPDSQTLDRFYHTACRNTFDMKVRDWSAARTAREVS